MDGRLLIGMALVLVLIIWQSVYDRRRGGRR